MLEKITVSTKNKNQYNLFSILIIIRTIINSGAPIIINKIVPNQNIITIFKGSCDTEDWSNDAENADIIKYIQIDYSYFELYLYERFCSCCPSLLHIYYKTQPCLII